MKINIGGEPILRSLLKAVRNWSVLIWLSITIKIGRSQLILFMDNTTLK